MKKMRRGNLNRLLGTLQMVRGPLKIPIYERVENRCRVCGGPTPKGRHYTCSVGCQIEKMRVVDKQ